MNISREEQITLERALEIAIRSVALEDGKEYRQLLKKFRDPGVNEAALDGIRYDYTDNQ